MKKIIDRVRDFIVYQQISVRSFEMKIGASNGLISRAIKNRTDISAEWLSKIINVFPCINTTWLLTGEGEMLNSVAGEAENIFQTKTTENVTLSNGNSNGNTNGNKRKLRKTLPFEEETFQTKTTENVTLSKGDLKGDLKGDFPKLRKTSPFDEDNSETKTTENVINSNDNIIDNIIDNKRKLRKTLSNIPPPGIASDVTVTYDAGGEDMVDSGRGIRREEMIPVYDITMFLNLSKLLANEYPPTSYMYLPNLRKCDGATLMPGDSMEPEIKRGDVIVYRKVKNKETGLFLGQIYLLSCELEGEVHVTVRYVLKSENEGYVQLASANKHYPPKDVPLESIKELAMIKASVRYNTMV